MKLTLQGLAWPITLVGVIALLDIAVRFARPPAGFRTWDYLELALSAANVVLMWLTYQRHQYLLGKLDSQTNREDVSSLSMSASLICFFAFFFLLQTLAGIHH